MSICLTIKKAIIFPDEKSKILWSQHDRTASQALCRNTVEMFSLETPGDIYAPTFLEGRMKARNRRKILTPLSLFPKNISQ